MSAVLPPLQNPREYKWIPLFGGVNCSLSKSVETRVYEKRGEESKLDFGAPGRLYKAQHLLLLSC